jgi:hypothetical protein
MEIKMAKIKYTATFSDGEIASAPATSLGTESVEPTWRFGTRNADYRRNPAANRTVRTPC